jgi:putative transcriptional regulator
MNTLKNHFLISIPHMKDPLFEKSVVFLCEHDEQGAMGLIINKEINKDSISVNFSPGSNQKIKFADYIANNKLYIGGPVLTSKMLFLHNGDTDNKSLLLNEKISISSDIISLISIAKSSNVKHKMFFGHAGWSQGQLEREIENGDWLIQKATSNLIFENEAEHIWLIATHSLGIEVNDITNTSGVS